MCVHVQWRAASFRNVSRNSERPPPPKEGLATEKPLSQASQRLNFRAGEEQMGWGLAAGQIGRFLRHGCFSDLDLRICEKQ